MTAPTRREEFDQGLAYVQIDYPPETDDPARIFRAMAKLIDAFHQVDRDLAHSVSAGIEPLLILERIEAGSLRAWLRTVVRQLDDDALKNLDWKPLIGQYLVRGKHRVLEWLDGRERIETRSQVLELQSGLIEVTPPESVEVLLVEPVPAERLLEDIRLLTEATVDLRPTDRVRYVSDEGETDVPTELTISEEEVERLLTEEVIRSQGRLLLLVKKPDYLGNSRWEFKLDDRTIEAKILDEPWLDRFRAGHVPLRPGDALDAYVRSEVSRGFEGNIVGTHYFVAVIHGVVRQSPGQQAEFDLE